MRNRVISISLAAALVFSIGLIGCGQGQPAASPAICSASEGNVSVMREGTATWVEAEVGMALEPADIIKCSDNSSAEITFLDGSTIELQAGTEIEVVSLNISTETDSSTIRLKQMIGSMIFRVTRIIDPASRYEVETPTATVAIRGSAVQITVTEDGTTWACNLGGDIWAIAQDMELQISEGRCCVIRPGQSPELITEGEELFVSALVEGVNFTAASTGIYRFRIIGGASELCPPDHPDYQGWITEVVIYKNGPILWSGGWYAPEHPNAADWDFSVGSRYFQPTYELAEITGTGMFVDIALAENEYVMLVVNDSKGYYWDNSGGVYLSVTILPPVPQYNLTISSTDGGSVTTPGEGNLVYEKGTAVDLVAEAEEGYHFVNWTGDVSTIASVNATIASITMSRNSTITANFAPKPAEIRTWYDLDATRDNLSGDYILMNNLDSATIGYLELASATANGGKGWEPIGTPYEGFGGRFSGQGYEIRDLFIYRPEASSVGLFGCVGVGGVIEHVGAADVVVTGYYAVGGLVGWNRGTVTDSYSTGAVSAELDFGNSVGGLVGQNEGTVCDSYSASSVTGEDCVGGLVGGNAGTVSDSYSIGDVAAGWSFGGLVGEMGFYGGSVSNSYYDYEEVLINGQNMITVGALFRGDFEQWLANDRSLNIDDRLSEKDGYYLIASVGDFKQLLAFGQDGSRKFRLENDLNLAAEPNLYIPYLAGEFDGNGHVIRNLSVDLFVHNVGLFGYLASTASVNNVRAEMVNIAGRQAVGGLVGWNDGTVTNSYSTGAVTAHLTAGGLVGHSNEGSAVNNSYSTADVTCESRWAGGLVGENGGAVSSSYSTGSVTAGESYVGGLVGFAFDGSVSNSYYDYEEVLINGQNMITVGALFNEDFDQWLANDKFLDINERLSQEDGYYLIDDVDDFKQVLAFGQDDSLRFRLRADVDLAAEPDFYIPYLAGEFDGDGHRILGLKLNFDFMCEVGLFGYLASGAKVTGVGVENGKVTGADFLGGLVGRNRGAVSDSYVIGDVTGSYVVGSLVGCNWGTVSDSYSTGSVAGESCVGGLVGLNQRNGTVSDSYSTGSVAGESFVGGLVGSNSRDSTVSNSYSTGGVTGDGVVGGLVGWNNGTVTNCYSTGSVTGSAEVGGLVGRSRETVDGSLWDTETSGQATSAAGTGKTTAEMKSIATFQVAEWSITYVANPSTHDPSYTWNIVDGQTYPFLSWQPVS